jgi:hypothetical protein
MAHELIHAFDHCRFKVDWSNLRHHACSEVSHPFAFARVAVVLPCCMNQELMIDPRSKSKWGL